MDKELLKSYINIDAKNIFEYQMIITQLNNIKQTLSYEELLKIMPTLTINDDEIILISDTHYGSTLENYSYIDLVFDYAKKNNIKTIIHGGDFIQGNYAPRKDIYQNIFEQLYYVLNNYPRDNDINTHLLFGNHDYQLLKKSYDLTFDIFESRKDINIIGLKQTYINWKNHIMYMNHYIPKQNQYYPRLKSFLKIHGHHHEYDFTDDLTKIYLPSLSDDIKYYGNVVYPGFLTIKLDDDSFEVKYILISNNKLYTNAPSLKKELRKNDYINK